uniref:Disease resistance protein RGA1 n=1 Tax=Elaeis guineensis var. tenera TaxID=51953 RepID=A0A6J0PR69_ELAGV|nr:putative disease resistance protein RGA1 [Elaeis guineensis]
MAEVILSALVQVLLKKSTSHILRQYGKMWGSTLFKELKKLESTLSTIQAVLQDAEEKQVKNEALKKWLADLKDAAYDTEDILDEFNCEVLRQRAEIRDRTKRKVWDFFSFHNPIIFRITMINKIKEIVERLDNIAMERSKFHLTEIGPVDRQYLSTERPETHSFVNESNIIGREEDKKKIVESLISRAGRSDVSVLPILGIGGLGKTTLAQLVYNEITVAEHFQQRIWVCVSENFDIKNIVKTIIESATQRKYELSDMDSLQRTMREVLSGKRFLLVLDDVWNPWEELKELLTTGADGSCVIATTRSTNVVSSIIGTLDAYELKPLSDDECWSLFERNAFSAGGAEKSAKLVQIGKAIVDKCGGLPLAAKMLGRLLRTKREEREWRFVMESEIWKLRDDEILPSLRLSYNHLPCHVKQCFAYCAIFPKDYEIDKEMLIQLWMANGFVPSDREEDMELKGQEIFNELLSRSFFQEFKEFRSSRTLITQQTCKMHDLIHDLAQSIMGNECQILDKPQSISNTAVRHLSITMDDPQLSTMEKVHTFKTLRTLLRLNGWRNIDLSHVNCAESKLRVLGLSGALINDFPISNLHLKHLRYLDFSRTHITALPEAASSLLNLQTLNLSHCNLLRHLPHGIRKMRSLKHLYLHGCESLLSMPRGIGQLRCLRTLTAYPVGNEIGSGRIKELKDLCIGGLLELHGLENVRSVAEAEAAHIGSKQDLQYLILRWSDGRTSNELIEGDADKVLEALQPPQGLKWLQISHYPGKRLPTWLVGQSMLLSNLVGITLHNCPKCEHVPHLGRLPWLATLKIDGLSSVKHMGGDDFYGSAGGGDQYDVVFPSLRTFVLRGMYDLEEWSGVEGRPSFPKLEDLTISVCPKLTTILRALSPMRRWENFNSLQRLTIGNCGSLISLPVEMIQCLSSVRYLEISNCESFIGCSSSSGGVAVLGLQHLTALETLVIDGCPKWGDFPNDSLHHLTALKEFTLAACEGATALPEFPESLLDLRIMRCHNISSLPEGLGRLTALEILQIRDLPKLSSLPRGTEGFTALHSLQIINLPKLSSLPLGMEGFTALHSLQIINLPTLSSLPQGMEGLKALEFLEINSLPELSSLPQWIEGLTALRRLEIHNLPKLSSLPQGMEGLTALHSLQIINLPNLSSLPQGLEGLTALKILKIHNLPKLSSLPQGMKSLTALEILEIHNLPKLSSLPQGMEGLKALKFFKIYNLPRLSSLRQGMEGLTALHSLQIINLPKLSSLPQGLKALKSLCIFGCPKLISLPKGLQQHLPSLSELEIRGCPKLERRCKAGGKYWALISGIPHTKIGR